VSVNRPSEILVLTENEVVRFPIALPGAFVGALKHHPHQNHGNRIMTFKSARPGDVSHGFPASAFKRLGTAAILHPQHAPRLMFIRWDLDLAFALCRGALSMHEWLKHPGAQDQDPRADDHGGQP